jgi:hypothetical protein
VAKDKSSSKNNLADHRKTTENNGKSKKVLRIESRKQWKKI